MCIEVVHNCGVKLYNQEINLIWDGCEGFENIVEFVEGYTYDWNCGGAIVFNEIACKKVNNSHVLVTVSYNKDLQYDNIDNEECFVFRV